MMKPILFNTDMVRAILEGRKTVTRRVVKPQPKAKLAYCCMGHGHGKWSYPGKDAYKYWEDESFKLPEDILPDELEKLWTPPCHTGDILYVRETWRKDVGRYMYKANYSDSEKFYRNGEEVSVKWRPSIHMPREAARIFLRVTDVRVERLHEITQEQAKAEGTKPFMMTADVDKPDEEKRWQEILPALLMFPALWDRTIKSEDRDLCGWDANPWCWVIEFERCEKPEGA